MSQQKDLINKEIEFKKKEKFKDALKILEDLLERNPNSENVKKALIEVLFDYGGYLNDEWVLDYKKAAECFKKIIELHPDDYRAWYNLGIAYFNLKNTEDALAAYQRAIQIKPDYMYCYYNIGLLYEAQKGELETALQYYEKALSYNKNFTYALQASSDVRQKLELLKVNAFEKEQKSIDTQVICKKCGNFNRVGAKFCDKCGERF
ncbi:MAG: tetratricopeptide repeat protein [Promethearchaeota archaeon]